MKKEIIRNRYVLLKEIGSGGFATIFLSWDYSLERKVAIKKIHKHFASDSRILEIFRMEALNVAKLQHENILQIYDFIRTVDNVCYIVMEYVDGTDLSKILKIAKEKNIKTISFPSISTGAYRFPVELASKIALKECTNFIKKYNFFEKIVFVCFDDYTFKSYINAYETILSK